MSDEKKASISELKLKPRYATEMMLERADHLEELARRIRAGIVPAVAIAWVQEENGAETDAMHGLSFEGRLPSLLGALAIVNAKLTNMAIHGNEL